MTGRWWRRRCRCSVGPWSGRCSENFRDECKSLQQALTMEEAVPPSDLHLDADFDKLEELEKSKGAAKCFLKKMKK